MTPAPEKPAGVPPEQAGREVAAIIAADPAAAAAPTLDDATPRQLVAELGRRLRGVRRAG